MAARNRRALVFLLCLAAYGQDPLAQLKNGADALDDGNPQAAIAPLRVALAGLPKIADYPAYFLARAYAQLKQHDQVPGAADRVILMKPDSPVAGYAALLGARSLLELKDSRGAAGYLTRVPEDRLPQPEATLLLARAQEGAGNLLAAAAAWQRLYYEYPLAEESADAAAALDRMKATLLQDYPEPSPGLQLLRPERMMRGRQYAGARREYLQLASSLRGPEQELARVRAGAADYQARKSSDAVSYLSSLDLANRGAEAERLWWLASAQRRLENDAGMEESVARLSRLAPDSEWRLQALVLAGNRYLVDNRFSDYLPHYKACADSFQNEPDAAYCHWKVVWRAWLERNADVPDLLREHLLRFPSSEKAGASLFYLGRRAAQDKDFAAARHYYRELESRYPNYYYAVLAREELNRKEISGAGRSAAAEKFTASVRWPARDQAPDFTPDAATKIRLERARLLAAARLERYAESEMRYGAKNGANPWALALEMAETASRRGDPAQAVRYIKGTVPGYLFLPKDAAPEKFWRLAFPFPYRNDIERFAKTYDLDPYLVASLIRQESEFDPRAVSSAGAIGLMQVMPSTGREISRRLRTVRSTTSRLKQPQYNLRLGTYYLQRLLNAQKGSVEETLAGYNAGASRVVKWREWGEFREPNEFVETIPFAQTRNYVQIIVRNRDIYRWLYSSPSPARPIATDGAGAAPKKPALRPPSKSSAKSKKK